MDLDRNAIGIIQAAFMATNKPAWDQIDALIEAQPEAERWPLRQRMVKHAITEQVRAEGPDNVLRQLSDIGTRRSAGGDYYATLGKDQIETALKSISDFVRTLP